MTSTNESRELSLADLVDIVRQSWLLVICVPVLAAVATFVVTSFLRPTYRAEALLSPTVPESGGRLARLAAQFSPLTQLVGDLDGSSGLTSKEVHIATLRSRWLTEEFIREENLLPALFPDRWDADSGKWRNVDGQSAQPSMDAAYELFDERIRSIDEDGSTGLVTLAIEWHDRQVIAHWANALVRRANESIRKRVIEESRRSIDFLEKELPGTQVVERRQVIARLIESRTSDIMLASAREDFAFIVVDEAVVPDAGSNVRPRRMLLALFGFFAGSLIAIVLAAIRWARRTGRERAP